MLIKAFFFGKPCVTAREQTEWVELVEHGFNTLVGSDTEKLVDAYRRSMQRSYNFSINLYGNGKASAVVAQEIERF